MPLSLRKIHQIVLKKLKSEEREINRKLGKKRVINNLELFNETSYKLDNILRLILVMNQELDKSKKHKKIYI